MKTKLVTSSIILALSVTPKLLFHASDSYINFYYRSSTYINRKIDTVLSRFNLQYIPVSLPSDNSRNAIISRYAKEFSLNPYFVSALIKHESSGHPDAYSPKGAIGLMQIMPANSKRCGLSSPSQLWNEESNIRCGIQIIAEEIKTYNGDIYKALLAYNGGPGAVTGNYPESLNHAKEVLRLYAINSVRILN